MKEDKIRKVQKYLKEAGADGWLLYDFHRSNCVAHSFLEIPKDAMITRRFFYWIPKSGNPIRIVHAIEPHVLDGWPGEKRVFLSWQSLSKEVGAVLAGVKRIAMEYSPTNPYISCVDGGTVDFVRSFGGEVISSGSFVSQFTAVIDAAQGASHIRAGACLERIVNETWHWIGKQFLEKNSVTEYGVQQRILREFERYGLVSDASPIVAVNAHSADPHYEPKAEGSSFIRKGDFILIDLWAKERGEKAVFGDITRVAVAAESASVRQTQVFDVVRAAQVAGIELIVRSFAEKKKVLGFEVDDAVRNVIREAGFGDYFTHRTGHSIGTELHGSGTHIDNLEMRDERPILPGTCFSIEPGIYLSGEFGIRLESDVYIHLDGRVEVTGGEQNEIFSIQS